jgi:hypothetical protein
MKTKPPKITVKTISIRFTWRGKPDSKKIDRTISEWMTKGFVVQSQQDKGFGCFLLPSSGSTKITFIKTE